MHDAFHVVRSGYYIAQHVLVPLGTLLSIHRILVQQALCGRPGPTVMPHRRYVLEEPLAWPVSEPENFIIAFAALAKLPLFAGYDGLDFCQVHCS